MRKLSLFIIILISVFCYRLSFSSEKYNINAELLVKNNDISIYYQKYCLLVPMDTQKYPLITKNPITFFFFVNNWTEQKINGLTVEEIQDSSLYTHSGRDTPFFFIMNFQRIEGFTLAKELQGLDKFGLMAKK